MAENMEKEKKKRSQSYNDINENDKAEFINGEVILHSPVMKAHSDAGSLLHQLLNTYVLKNDLGFTGYEKIMMSIDTSHIKTIKGDFKKFLKEVFFENIMSGKTKTYARPSPYKKCCDALYKEEFIQIMQKPPVYDGTFYPETSSDARPTFNMIDNMTPPEELAEFRLHQLWYYDDNRRQLYTQLYGIAPIRRVHDENGKFKYIQPMFYLVFEK